MHVKVNVSYVLIYTKFDMSILMQGVNKQILHDNVKNAAYISCGMSF